MTAVLSSLGRKALSYARRRVFVFPCAPQSKRPLIPGGRGYLDATIDTAQVCAWWRDCPDGNIGCWPGRSGFVVVDVDGLTGEAAARALGLLEVPTLVCVTGRADGRHLYFRRPDFHVGNRALAPHLDVRCDDGYTLLPPSRHSTGAIYKWQDALARPAELPPKAREALRRAQHDPEAAAAYPTRVSDLTVPDSDELARRIRAYIDTVGIRAEGERNNVGYRLSAWLVRDMARSHEEAYAWLSAWNASNRPPLSQRELTQLFRSAVRTARRTPGSGLVRAPFSHAHQISKRLPFAHARPCAGTSELFAHAQRVLVQRVAQ